MNWASISRPDWRPWLAPMALVAAWAITSSGQHDTGQQFIVSPVNFLATLLQGLRDGSLPGAVLSTLARAIAGFLIGSAFGLGLGLVIGLRRGPRLIISPTVDALRQVALFAWIPLLSAWLGNGEAMKISLIALGAFFPVALAAAAGCANTPLPFLEVGRTLELGRRAQVTTIVLPAAAPDIVAGLELSLNIAWLGTIGSEYLIGTGYINGMGDGVGAYLAAAREHARMDQVLVGVLALAISGLALDRSVARILRRVFPWQSR